VLGAEDWMAMEAFAEGKEAWLRGFLELPNGASGKALNSAIALSIKKV